LIVQQLEISPFIAEEAVDEDWLALNRFRNLMLSERLPDDPPESVERTRTLLLAKPDFVDATRWVAWHHAPGAEKEIIAYGIVIIYNTKDNKHALFFNIEVHPEHRRKGVGTHLLSFVTVVASETQRRLLITQTLASVPAGEKFLERIGARVGLDSHVNQLDIADVDRDLLRRWQERAKERAVDFDMGLWVGPYPEEHIQEIVDLTKAMNLAPRGDLEVEDADITVDQLRQQEEMMAKRGMERWTMYVRHRPSGELAGYTYVWWVADRPLMVQQEDTAVWPKYRNLGLGRWLKAAMLEKVMRERPQVKHIRTGNADTNAAMLNINNEMGFKPHMAEKVWQADLDRVQDYLASR
jgi:GNAT superfamily N-acetyltransferase